MCGNEEMSHWRGPWEAGCRPVPTGGNCRVIQTCLKGDTLDVDEILLPNPINHHRILGLESSRLTPLYYGPKTRRSGVVSQLGSKLTEELKSDPGAHKPEAGAFSTKLVFSIVALDDARG